MSSSTDNLITVCEDYNISAAALQISAASELLSGGTVGKNSRPRAMLETLEGVLDEQGLMNVVRWATWVQHAKDNNADGADIPSLLALRREKDGS